MCPDGWEYFNKTQKCYTPVKALTFLHKNFGFKVTEDGAIVLSDFNYTRNWCINNKSS